MLQGKKVAFYTLGCKLNFSETSTIGRSFKEMGFESVKTSEKADIYVINTCSVTNNDYKSTGNKRGSKTKRKEPKCFRSYQKRNSEPFIKVF